ncbi:MAG TPA: MarR family winged helix-turn-helix transcriptional regulator [Rhodanobacter sp.]
MTSRSDALYALTNALQPVRRAWQHVAGTVLIAPGVSQALTRSVLLVARLGDGAQQSVLADEMGAHPATLVRLLDQAEQLQLLERRNSPTNRRIKTIYLQAEGRRLAAQMERAVGMLRETLLADIPLADLETATRVLRALGDRARDHAGEPHAGQPPANAK